MSEYEIVWRELVRAEGNKNDEHEAYGIERQHHGADFDAWPPTEDQARNWYYRRVWQELGIDQLPAAIRIDVFLFVLNASLIRGPERNAPMSSKVLGRTLQVALNAVGHRILVDGDVGPLTRRALERTPHTKELHMAVRGAILMYYSGLRNFEKHQRSWLRRYETV